MDCVTCPWQHQCRTQVQACRATRVDLDELSEAYQEPGAQAVVQAAARLVDGGRAGTLSRVEELIEFTREMGYRRVGLAYCYGLERDARAVLELFKARGVPLRTVSCTAGGLAQSQVNSASELPGVSCNPLSQARQLMLDRVELAVTFGLCLGHDILFHREFRGDVTNLLVKDRTSGHAPLVPIQRLAAELNEER